MSGIYLDAACYARRSFGARIWIDRASRHVLSQDEILAAIPGADRPSPLTIRRELAGYSLADRIAVPSYHVMKSFERDVSLGSKLFRNPFGVDLAMFPRRGNVKAAGKDINLIFVGTWSYRKGCDILISVIKRLQNARLVHLGAIGDIQFPSNDRKFIHFDPVVQSRVYQFYQGADVFVLASREEGLSTALIQALAGGLPVICTDRTGGADLAHTPGLAERITVIPHDDAEALTMAVLELHDRLRNGFVFSELSDADRETLSWKEYAKRYCEAISNDERHFARRPP
jgi:glycosyltransferase involved in cell wall biosynthesis